MRRDSSPYFYDSFTRQQWARFDAGSYRLAPAALTLLKGVNEPMPISEVEEVIGPLCRLLDIQMEANDITMCGRWPNSDFRLGSKRHTPMP
jgi:pantothenate kinase